MSWYDRFYLGEPDDDDEYCRRHLAKGAGVEEPDDDDRDIDDRDCDYWQRVMKDY